MDRTDSISTMRGYSEDEPVALRPKTFALLAYLVQHAGQLVTKEALLDAVWPESIVSEGILKTSINELRKTLGETAKTAQWIATVQRRGYRFMAPVVEQLDPADPASAALTSAPSVYPAPLAVEPPRVGLTPPTATRRYLTVLYCELVEATALAVRLDLEEYLEVMRAYHQTCATMIRRFEGSVAQALGKGMLGYFGYPVAHEDDAQRAVRAGLDLLAALAVPAPSGRLAGEALVVRLGVHTGVAVVDEAGTEVRPQPLALGETPQLAMHLPRLAAPNTLVLSAATQQLVAGHFRCKPLGTHPLPGLTQPLEVYQVLGFSSTQSRLEVAAAQGLSPLVGREYERRLLLTTWQRVTTDFGQVVFLGGEAALGRHRPQGHHRNTTVRAGVL